MMPSLGCQDLQTEVRRVAPDLAERMIFMTGGAFTPRAQEFLARVPRGRLLTKPFGPDELLAALALIG